MNLVEWLQRLMTNFGAEWVMWLLLGLSVISVAIMLERAYFYHQLKDDTEKLASELRERLRKADLEGARKLLGASPSAEAAVVMSGLDEADRGAKSASEAMAGAKACSASSSSAGSPTSARWVTTRRSWGSSGR